MNFSRPTVTAQKFRHAPVSPGLSSLCDPPTGIPEDTFDRALDVFLESELEEVRLLPVVQGRHQGVGTLATVAPDDLRLAIRRKFDEYLQ